MSQRVGPRSRWVDRLSPADHEVIGRSVLPAASLERLAAEVGSGPVGWAVELGQGMARHIAEQVPALATDGVVQEIRRGCESVALGVLAALTSEDPPDVVGAELLQGPAELVSRGIGMEEMLKSLRLAQSFATRAVVAAIERVVPPVEQFTETTKAIDLIFAVTELASEAMSGEFARVQKAWLTSSSAARMELVQELLAGGPVSPARVGRTLGYDLSRRHTGLVVWGDEAGTGSWELQVLAEETLRARGCSATLVLPVGRRRVWAWGSSLARPAAEERSEPPPPPPGICIALGLPGGPGADGFRRTHVEALEAAAVGKRSTSGRRVFPYQEVDLLVMLMQRPDLARDFVLRELGALAGPGPAAATLRATIKCYLDVERSLAQAAARLSVARNTVSYRVHRAEELRGRDVSERRMQLQAALALAEEFGDLLTEPRPGVPPAPGS